MFTFKEYIRENWFEVNDNSHLKRRESLSKQLGAHNLTEPIKNYINNSKPVNKALLAGKSHHDVDSIDEFIENNKLPTKLHVYSALGKNAHQALIDQNQTPTYLSTTPHKDVAKGYAVKSDDGYHHIAHIVLSPNSSATHLGGHENEVLIDRGQKLQYHGTRIVKEGEKNYKVHKFSI